MLASLVSRTASIARGAYLAIFECASTFLWFSMFPVSKISDWAKARCPDSDYKLNIFQYYFLSFPGAVNALTVIGLSWGLMLLHFPLYLSVILASIAYPLMSGGIHLDGLSDSIDALLAYNKDKFQVLTDPHCGALGAVYAMLFTLTQVAIYSTLLYIWLTAGVPAYWAILVPAIVARVAVFYILMSYYPEYHPKGLEHLFPEYHPFENLEFGYRVYCTLLPIVAAIAIWFAPNIVLPLVVSIGCGLFVAKVVVPGLIRNLGFFFGDNLGLSILLIEIMSAFILVPYYNW